MRDMMRSQASHTSEGVVVLFDVAVPVVPGKPGVYPS
jgi:hypothetical protein